MAALNRLLEHINLLQLLKNSKVETRKVILEHCNQDLVCCLSECCLNILNSNIKLSHYRIKQLRKYRNIVRCLASPNPSLEFKRQLLLRRNNFLPPLLSTVLRAVSTALENDQKNGTSSNGDDSSGDEF